MSDQPQTNSGANRVDDLLASAVGRSGVGDNLAVLINITPEFNMTERQTLMVAAAEACQEMYLDLPSEPIYTILTLGMAIGREMEARHREGMI